MTGGRSGWRLDAQLAVHDGRAEISAEHGGFLGAGGGYASALALRAMATRVDDEARPPRSLAVQLLAPLRAGCAADVAVSIERQGRSASFASVAIDQAGAAVARAQSTFGVDVPSRARVDTAMPQVPPPADCRPLFENPVGGASGFLVVEHRPAAGALPLTGGADAEILVWMRLVEERPLDAVSLAYLADAAVPALYAALTEPLRMPSVEIQLQFAGWASATPWVLGAFRSRTVAAGWAVEDGELWSEAGTLLLLSRQLRRVLG